VEVKVPNHQVRIISILIIISRQYQQGGIIIIILIIITMGAAGNESRIACGARSLFRARLK